MKFLREIFLFKAHRPIPIPTESPDVFTCLRFEQFPAWSAAQHEPFLFDKPFAVCEFGAVIAVSPLARKAGVRVGMRSGTASARCPALFILPRDKDREVADWRQIQREISLTSPSVESSEIGLLVSQTRPARLTRILRDWSKNGSWPVRAGSASDRATAFLAMQNAPDGACRAVKSGCESSFAGKKPLAFLAGDISLEAQRKLDSARLRNVRDLRKFSIEQLETEFGSDGATLFRFAQGALCEENLRPVEPQNPPAKSVQLVLFRPSFCELNGRETYEIAGAEVMRSPAARFLF